MRRKSWKALLPYAFAVLLIVAATVVTKLIWPQHSNVRFTFFYLGIFVAAIYGHVWAGGLAFFLGALAVNYFFIPPVNAFSMTREGFLAVGSFSCVGIVFLGLIHRMRRNESYIRESEMRLKTVTDTAGVGLVIVDAQHQYRYANRAYAEILALPVKTLVGLRVADVLPDIYESQIRPRLERAFQGEAVNYELRLPPTALSTDERFYSVSYEPGYDQSGPIAVVVISDISALKRTETKLRESVQETVDLKAAFNEHAIVAITDANGRITEVNDKFCEISKYSREELLGEDHRIVNSSTHSKDFFRDLWRTIGGGHVWHGDIKNKAKDGSFYWVATTIVPFLDVDGKPRQFVAIRADITARKLAEEARARLSGIVRSSSDAIIGKTLDGVITSWNSGAEKIFGYAPEDAVGQPMLMLFPPELVDEESVILGKVTRGESIPHYETQRIRKDGQRIDVSVTVSPVEDSEGRIIGASKIARDITEQKRAEKAQRESEEQFRTMANSIPQLAWMARADGFIFWYNQRWFDYTGTTPEAMEGWGWQIVHNPDFLPKAMERWQAALATGQPFEMEIPLRGADGQFRIFLTRVHPLRDSNGEVVQWFGTNTDVEELKRVEESLRDTQARLNSTLAAGSIGTWTWDIPNDRLAADEFTARVFSVDPAAAAKGIPAADYLEAIDEEDRPSVAEALAHAIENCSEYDIEYRVPQFEGGFRWLQARGRVECDNLGKASYFHGAVIDVTERKRAAAALRETEKERQMAYEANRLKSEFLANMSHELRTPLNCIIGFTEFLVDERPGPLNPKQKEYLTDVHSSSQHLLQLINDVLDLAKVEAGKSELHVEEFALVKAIEEVCAVGKGMAQKRQVNLVWSVSPDLDVVYLDQQKFKQICFNLLSNAVKFADANGRVDIDVVAHDGEVFELRVKDTGIGIKETDIQRLFHEFEQLDSGHARRFEGTGLGLALTKKLVELQGGRMVVHSEFGKGSTFSAILPIRLTEARAT